MDFVDNCYLIKHAQGWFLWDTGIADAVADMPNGLAPADPRATTWRRPKTLAAQLEQLGVKPSDLKAMAVSHTHPDHIGNVEMFPNTMLYVQKAEYEWPGTNNAPRFKPEHPVTKLEGDKDIFGDGSIVILFTPGHTPGHQSLVVKLPKTGSVILTSDVVYLKENLDKNLIPPIPGTVSPGDAYRSYQRVRLIRDANNAQIFYGHDPEVFKATKHAPEFYD